MPEEHPILMHDRSIKGILAGRKTQTRRVIDPQPPDPAVVYAKAGTGFSLYRPSEAEGNPFHEWFDPDEWHVSGPVWAVRELVDESTWTCPYGKPGDHLWVRETFRLPDRVDDQSPKEVVEDLPDPEKDKSRSTWPPVRYEADGTALFCPGPEPPWGRKRQSIHIPRKLSRILLKVKDIRVEQVQDIDAMGARAEGVPEDSWTEEGGPVTQFRRRWNDTQSNRLEYRWENNPWVWVIEFARKRVWEEP